MKQAPHLLVYISAHGFGHIAQVAPVLNALTARLPDLRLTISSTAPLKQLESRIAGEFHYLAEAADFGMVMASATEVMVEPSMLAYAAFHQGWTRKVAAEADRITQLAPDLVLSDVAYLPLAAAKQAGIPCAGMCSLNWADIFRHYCADLPGATNIHAQMRQAYAEADAFLRLTPGMPMADLPNLEIMGPVASIGLSSRSKIESKLGMRDGERLALVTMGGISSRLPMERWPELPGIRWLVAADWNIRHPQAVAIESLGMDFTDLLANCDALLCKTGYGAFVEAACNGVPVLYAGRPDWPEQPCLVEWLATHGRCLEVGREELEDGALAAALDALLAAPRPEPVVPDGNAQVANFLSGMLR